MKWAVKDARLALDAFQSAGGGALPGLERITATWAEMLDDQRAEADLSVVHTAFI